MPRGNLYRWDSDQPIGEVEYSLYNESSSAWHGELIFVEYRKIANGDGYVLKLEDGRHGRCSLNKMINKAVSGFPTMFYYMFRGNEVSKEERER